MSGSSALNNSIPAFFAPAPDTPDTLLRLLGGLSGQYYSQFSAENLKLQTATRPTDRPLAALSKAY